jgi:hypothetical protein
MCERAEDGDEEEDHSYCVGYVGSTKEANSCE